MDDIKDIIEEIKSRCDIADVISEYMNIKQSGNNYKGLCPFHGEKTPSFYINSSKQMYKCFGCGEGGDVIRFVMKMENLEFMDALKILANKCGLEINTNMSKEAKIRVENMKKFQDIHVEAARFYLSNLVKQKNHGYDYLIKRGLDDKTIRKFGLGFSIDSWQALIEYLTNKGYSKEELLECGLVNKNEKSNHFYDKFRNRVMFPIFDYRGNVIGFGGRVLDDSLPKYLNSPETIIFNKRENLYGLNFARKNINNKIVVLVEGYMDLISLYQYGVKNVVATLGTALTREQGKLLKRYVDTVIISYDSDEAGVQATLRAIDVLTNLDINVKVLNLKDCKDPDEFVRKYGIEKYRESIDTSTPYMKFKINYLKTKFNIKNDEDRIKFVKEATNLVKTLKSPIDTDYYTKYLSDQTNISIESIKKEVYGKNYRKSYDSKFRERKEEKIIEKPKVITDGNIIIEQTFLKIIMECKDARENSILKISEEDFHFNESKEILNYIIKYKELDKITIDKIKSLNLSEGYMVSLTNISLDGINLEDFKQIEEIIKSVKKNKIQSEINSLLEKLQYMENDNSKNDMKEVDLENMELEKMKISQQIIEKQKKINTI